MNDMYIVVFVATLWGGLHVVYIGLYAIPTLVGQWCCVVCLLEHRQQMCCQVIPQEVISGLRRTEFVVEVLLKQLLVGFGYHGRRRKHRGVELRKNNLLVLPRVV